MLWCEVVLSAGEHSVRLFRRADFYEWYGRYLEDRTRCPRQFWNRIHERERQAIFGLALSSRACPSILKVARTIADLDEAGEVGKDHLLEAVQHRRYGEEDSFWSHI